MSTSSDDTTWFLYESFRARVKAFDTTLRQVDEEVPDRDLANHIEEELVELRTKQGELDVDRLKKAIPDLEDVYRRAAATLSKLVTTPARLRTPSGQADHGSEAAAPSQTKLMTIPARPRNPPSQDDHDSIASSQRSVRGRGLLDDGGSVASSRRSVDSARLKLESRMAWLKVQQELQEEEEAIQAQLAELKRKLGRKRLDAAMKETLAQQEVVRRFAEEDAGSLRSCKSAPFIDVPPVQTAQPTPPPNISSAPFSPLIPHVQQLGYSKLPAPEPEVFEGDPLLYPQWKASFSALIDRRNLPAAEKIMYLKRYLGGPAKACVAGMFLLDSEEAYQQARSILERRFGSEYAVADSFRQKLENWPQIKDTDSEALQDFADYLQTCKVAATRIRALRVFDDPFLQRIVLRKLPDHLISDWGKVARDNREPPVFAILADFVTMKADEANDPFTSLKAIRQEDLRMEGQSYQSGKKICRAVTTERDPCAVCGKAGHSPKDCYTLQKMNPDEVRQAIVENKMCFSCLEVGHFSRACLKRENCLKCGKQHPTLLHREQVVPAINHKIHTSSASHTSSQIVPVYVDTGNGSPILTYALLDNQSDTSFVSDTLAARLHINKEPALLEVETLTDVRKVKCQRIQNLRIVGLFESMYTTVQDIYSTPSIPVNRSHIPTSDKAKEWPHLKNLPISPLLDVEVGLLLGYDCPSLLRPLDVAAGDADEPYGVRTVLGWSFVGGGKVMEPKVVKCRRIKVKEVLACMDQDFQDVKDSSHSSSSQEDLQFLRILKEGVLYLEDGSLELPHPKKDCTLQLPDNQIQVISRLKGLQRKFERSPKFQEAYSAQVSEMLRLGDTEVVPPSEKDNTSWYVPHHRVVRGHVQKIFCDRGTHFVGADRELREALKKLPTEMIQSSVEEQGIQFEFSTPSASHMGGVWERQIRTVRGILTPMLKQFGSRLTLEDLQTLMAECSYIVDSRPLSTSGLTVSLRPEIDWYIFRRCLWQERVEKSPRPCLRLLEEMEDRVSTRPPSPSEMDPEVAKCAGWGCCPTQRREHGGTVIPPRKSG